eukprot:5751015-Alexandrium_andersonii.AAC.1
MRSCDRLPPATSSQSFGTSPRRASSGGTSMPSGLSSSIGLQPASLRSARQPQKRRHSSSSSTPHLGQ